jgi:hypothetical protein
MSEPYKCGSCGKHDVWLNFEGYENVCHSCGDVHSTEFSVASNEYFKDHYTFKYNNFYQAKFHFNERMSQWCNQEPHIPDSHLRKILGACTEYESRGTKLESKRDIQRILRSIGKYYSKKYLEKWLTILQIYHRKSFYPVPENTLVESLQYMFSSIMSPWFKTKPHERKHLPNYNYIIRQFLYIIDPALEKTYTLCFPLLQSKKKLQSLDKVWKPLCEYNEWEYRPLYVFD